MTMFLKILLLPTLLLTAVAARAATLTPRETPAHVAAAVARIHELGRDQLDLGGVASVHLFAIESAATVEALVASVVAATAADPKSGLARFCEAEEIPALDFDSACARAIASGARGHHVLEMLDALAARMALLDAVTDGGQLVERDMSVLRLFVLDNVGADYVELGARANVFGVDVGTAILIDRAQRVLVVIHYDAGA